VDGLRHETRADRGAPLSSFAVASCVAGEERLDALSRGAHVDVRAPQELGYFPSSALSFRP
jgi:hypothetical protein